MIAPAQFEVEFPHRDDSPNAGDVGHDAFVVVSQQAVGFYFAVVGRFISRFAMNAADDDIGGTQIFNLLLSLIADSFAHRDQPDDGRGADEDSERRERRSHFLQRKALESKLECSKEGDVQGICFWSIF